MAGDMINSLWSETYFQAWKYLRIRGICDKQLYLPGQKG